MAGEAKGKGRLARRLMKWGAVAAGLLAVPAALYAWPAPTAEPADYAGQAAGPVDARTVYWVGHSLMAHRDPHVEGAENVIERVGRLAEARGLAYESYAQTHHGSPISLAWRGVAHSHPREEPELAARREELMENGARYDAMVITGWVPIEADRRWEHAAWYATRFACALLERNPDARIYLYSSWVNLQATEAEEGVGSPAAWDWPARVREERRGYEELADEVSAGVAMEPGVKGRFTRWLGGGGGCAMERPVFLVPVGAALGELHAALPREGWTVDGEPLTILDFFANPYVEWPEEWPTEGVDEATARARMETLPTRYPDAEVDDIHNSALGSWFAALVHFATLYRQSPVGLPGPPHAELSDAAREGMQELVWRVVREDPRAGVE
ncbi:MAG TPA: hypothetical protein RMH85_28630 [Polyangiaceae bacterium LLY-WYZ-15_(1-7)]|nr:hypothetical protein [Myxococcales bacterium]MAT27479.1 hypothetical protein [Sandaracinus sp.]HJK94838.1 hypothetical protein [Polyangiaceae bacterium LLY-WYZ-15_(1-7)]MBJ70070.1 hypothetical protein [Sandaracinus sp.]HJL02320.1 hypothetical protein [Polyangiaceae bacterium LLY-WYZ-15_(1-7)]